jgi:uncharacterized membrane protein YdbT with pleckstrin-like domain
MPRQLLAGENLVLPPLHRHWILLVRSLFTPGAVSLIVLVGVDILMGSVLAGDLRLVVTLMVLGVFALFAGVAYLQWAAASLTVTDQRVILEEGIFNRTSKVIPLDRVQDVSTKQSLVGRMLDYGTVEIDAAGAAGAEVFPYVRSPEMLRDQVFVLSDHLRRRE